MVTRVTQREQPELATDERVIVPLRDEHLGGRIYSPWMLWAAMIGGVLGAVGLGWLAYAIAEGALPIAGLGQFAASGDGVATFTGAGVGFAVGALAAALISVYSLPLRKPTAVAESRFDDDHRRGSLHGGPETEPARGSADADTRPSPPREPRGVDGNTDVRRARPPAMRGCSPPGPD